MLTKLTLTIDKDVIEKAKEYAQQKNKSVSRIVEEYLKNISQNRMDLAFELELKSPITDSLVGMFEDNGKDYKTMLEEARSEKFS
jgi:Family of unknown function (DUF6364)